MCRSNADDFCTQIKATSGAYHSDGCPKWMQLCCNIFMWTIDFYSFTLSSYLKAEFDPFFFFLVGEADSRRVKNCRLNPYSSLIYRALNFFQSTVWDAADDTSDRNVRRRSLPYFCCSFSLVCVCV